MSDSKSWSGLLGALAVVAGLPALVLLLLSGSQGANGFQDAAKAPRQSDAKLLRLLGPFFKDTPLHNCPGFTSSNFRGLADCLELPAKAFVLLVPDPVNSGMGSSFDNFLDSIRAAGGEALLTFHGWSMPWVEATIPSNESPTSSEGEPGFLLFSKREKGAGIDKLILVVVVAETQTAGPDIPALRTAFEIARELGSNEDSRDGASFEVPILGPTFSGSAPSIKHFLGTWGDWAANGGMGVRFVSGSATGIGAKDICSIVADRCSYQATIYPDSVTQRVLRSLLANPAREAEAKSVPLGTLVESGTAYAEALVDLLNVHPESSELEADRLESLKDGGRESTPTSKPLGRLKSSGSVAIRFPLEISRIRRELSQLDLAQQRESAASGTVALAVPMVAESDNALSPPLFGQNSGVRMAADLRQAAVLVRKLPIKNWQIVATNSEDTRFVAGHLRSEAPGRRVWLTDPDILFVHPEVVSRFFGSAVISTYPLSATSQLARLEGDKDLSGLSLFPSQAAEGVFNAFLLLLHQPEALKDFGRKRGPEGATYISPSLWLSITGRDGFYPVRQIHLTEREIPSSLRFDAPSSYAIPEDRMPQEVRPSIFFWVISLALLVLVGLFDVRLPRKAVPPKIHRKGPCE
jgi:hypothetical protein